MIDCGLGTRGTRASAIETSANMRRIIMVRLITASMVKRLLIPKQYAVPNDWQVKPIHGSVGAFFRPFLAAEQGCDDRNAALERRPFSLSLRGLLF